MSDTPPFDSYPPDATVAPPARKPSSGTVVAAVIGAMALIFGTLALVRAVNQSSGASSAEDAVRDLFDAVANEDVIGVLQTLEPAERDSLKDPIEDISDELKRLGVLAPGFDLQSISGVALDFTDVALSSTTLSDGIVAVSVEDATLNAAIIPEDLPLGPFFDEFFEETEGEDPREAEPTEESTPLEEPFDIVAVERDGGWYVSLWYSVAEAARQDAELEPPVFGQGVRPDGAGSPEEAVRELIDAGVALDLRKVFALMPPGEASALHDYAPLFLDEAEEDIAELREEEDFQIEVSDLELNVAGGDDRARVAIESFSVDATFADGFLRGTYGGDSFSVEYEGEDESGTVEYDGECIRVVTEYEDASDDFDRFDDSNDSENDFSSEPESTDEEVCRGDEDFPPFPEDFENVRLTLTAVKVDGAWFVSPTRTVLDSVVQGLELLDEEDLEAFTESIFGGFLFPFGMRGDGGFESFEGSEESGELEFELDDDGFGSSTETTIEAGESFELTPEQEACYDALDRQSDEDFESGAEPPECEGVFGD